MYHNTQTTPKLMNIFTSSGILTKDTVENIQISILAASAFLAGVVEYYDRFVEPAANHESLCVIHPGLTPALVDRDIDEQLSAAFLKYSTETRDAEGLNPEELESVVGSCIYYSFGWDGIQKLYADAWPDDIAGSYLTHTPLDPKDGGVVLSGPN